MTTAFKIKREEMIRVMRGEHSFGGEDASVSVQLFAVSKPLALCFAESICCGPLHQLNDALELALLPLGHCHDQHTAAVCFDVTFRIIWVLAHIW